VCQEVLERTYALSLRKWVFGRPRRIRKLTLTRIDIRVIGCEGGREVDETASGQFPKMGLVSEV
jgi:hypothetical protein